MTSLLVGGALLAAGLTPHTPAFAAAASLLALLVGACRCALAAANGGALLAHLPRAVLDGFTLGVVWLVAATQLPVVLGAAPPAGMHFAAAAAWLLCRPALWQWGAIATAATTAGLLLGGKRCVRARMHAPAVEAGLTGAAACQAASAVPWRHCCVCARLRRRRGRTACGSHCGCAAAASCALRACACAASADAGGAPSIHAGAVHAGLPRLLAPSALPWHLLPALLPAAAAIAVVGFAEAAAISRRCADDDGQRWDCNRELWSQGAANVASAAFGGCPVGGSLSRTSLGRTAGATSQLAHAATGCAVLLFLPLGAPLLAALPRAVLGGLVTCAMLPLMRPQSTLLPAPDARRAGSLAAWPLRDPLLGWATALATIAARRPRGCAQRSAAHPHQAADARSRAAQASPRLEIGLEVGLALAAASAAGQAAADAWRRRAA